MEKDGDLADIVRASTSASATGGDGGGGGNRVLDSQLGVSPSWHVQSSTFLPSGIPEELDTFGNPFSHLHDPLLHELDLPSSGFFSPSNSLYMDETPGVANLPRKMFEEDTRRPTNNIFSRMLQISPSSKMSSTSHTSGNSPCTNTATSDMIMASPRILDTTMASSYGKETIARNPSIETMQISPRNPGIKRRKSQAKKVVCIPAPAAANSSRTSGEVVPSDLWAWRKYGQKPIKGSPYPRGYYRCSSSKGCSARKQVERSRTDPNMLVITYTSEHNHPWPTQRNALAGSTRSQPPKSNAASKTTSTSPKTSSKLVNMKEEQHQEEFVNASIPISAAEGPLNASPTIKQELGDKEKSIDIGDKGDMDSFFADLGELEYDPMNLFVSEFSGEKLQENKPMDPFSLFDWAGNSNVFEENKRGGI